MEWIRGQGHWLDVAPRKTAIKLVALKVGDKELGFKNQPTTEDLYARAKEKGYRLCPEEAGPQLCLQHPIRETLYVAMIPVWAGNGPQRVFMTKYNPSGEWAGLWLDSAPCAAGTLWDLEDTFVFMAPSK